LVTGKPKWKKSPPIWRKKQNQPTKRSWNSSLKATTP
jgi:hypothetical protein